MKLYIEYNAATKDSADFVVNIEKVSVRYSIPHERIISLKEYAISRLKRTINYKDFWALRNISLEIYPGETIGIIGSNGAGKTTLLKVVARVLRPTEGRIRIRGHIAPLLGMGAGFDLELSGRDNIFLNGAMLGLSKKKISKHLNRIVEFSGICDFFDAPIRTYSTGMAARLGFAIATEVRPDILIVDEVLSVGDSEFQEKCLNRIKKFREQGTAILLVSHNLEQIKSFCERIVWLDQGMIRACGSKEEVLQKYTSLSQG